MVLMPARFLGYSAAQPDVKLDFRLLLRVKCKNRGTDPIFFAEAVLVLRLPRLSPGQVSSGFV